MECRRSYFDRFRLRLSKDELNKLNIAYNLAKDVHRDQTRESGERYFEHVRAVSIIIADLLGFYDVELHIIALLHDSIEDRLWFSSKVLELVFGRKVMLGIKLISKPRVGDKRFRFQNEQEILGYYHRKLKEGPLSVQIVKLADRLHNLKTLSACSRDKQIRKVRETIDNFTPILDRVQREYPEQGAILKNEFTKAINALSVDVRGIGVGVVLGIGNFDSK